MKKFAVLGLGFPLKCLSPHVSGHAEPLGVCGMVGVKRSDCFCPCVISRLTVISSFPFSLPPHLVTTLTQCVFSAQCMHSPPLIAPSLVEVDRPSPQPSRNLSIWSVVSICAHSADVDLLVTHHMRAFHFLCFQSSSPPRRRLSPTTKLTPLSTSSPESGPAPSDSGHRISRSPRSPSAGDSSTSLSARQRSSPLQ